MCMTPAQQQPDVGVQKQQAIAGEPITSQDPTFKVNKPSRRRMKLRINRPSSSS